MLLSAFNTTGHGKDAHAPRLLAFNGGNGFVVPPASAPCRGAFNLQILFNPFEKQINLPALFMEVDLDQGKLTGNDVSSPGSCRNAELVRPQAAVCGFVGLSGVKLLVMNQGSSNRICNYCGTRLVGWPAALQEEVCL